jgi:hypothetical protein
MSQVNAGVSLESSTSSFDSQSFEVTCMLPVEEFARAKRVRSRSPSATVVEPPDAHRRRRRPYSPRP